MTRPAASVSPTPPRSSGKGWWLLLIAAGLLTWFWSPLSRLARTGSAYGAHVTCACHFIAGRDLKQCRADFMPGMAPVTISADPGAQSITARYLLLFAETAKYRPGEGCVLEKWGD